MRLISVIFDSAKFRNERCEELEFNRERTSESCNQDTPSVFRELKHGNVLRCHVLKFVLYLRFSNEQALLSIKYLQAPFKVVNACQ